MTKRIVYLADVDEFTSLDRSSKRCGISKLATIRLAVRVLARLIDEISRGAKLVFRDRDGVENELWLPQLVERRRSSKGGKA